MSTSKTEAPLLPIACNTCQCQRQVAASVKGLAKLPKGWKRLGPQVFCNQCWQKTYVIRAITVRVSSAEWKLLYEALRATQYAVGELMNWAVRKLLTNDVIRTPGLGEKMPKMPPIYLYGAGPECPAWSRLAKSTASCVLQTVEQNYRKRRYAVVWTSKASPPYYNHPQPIPLRPDSFKLLFNEEAGRFALQALLGDRRKHTMLLASGYRYGRQRKALAWLFEHPELLAQAQLITVSTTKDHRPSENDRVNGNGQRRFRRLLVKLVGWFPTAERALTDNTLFVRTDKDALLIAVDQDSERVWTYNADHARQIAIRHSEHMRRLSRLSEDHKAERRKPRRDGRPYREHLSHQCGKDKRRLQSLCHEVSASLVEYAARRRVTDIVFDPSEKSFCYSFPWAMLRIMIQQKAAAKQIQFEVTDAKQPDPPETIQEELQEVEDE